jgi:hypothetical protein
MYRPGEKKELQPTSTAPDASSKTQTENSDIYSVDDTQIKSIAPK